MRARIPVLLAFLALSGCVWVEGGRTSGMSVSAPALFEEMAVVGTDLEFQVPVRPVPVYGDVTSFNAALTIAGKPRPFKRNPPVGAAPAMSRSDEYVDLRITLAHALEAYVRDEFPDAEPVARRLSNGPPAANPIEVRITGRTDEALWRAVEDVKGYLRTDLGHIGFHGIPTSVFDGSVYQTTDELGTRLSGGCQRQHNLDAMFMWGFAPVGTTVVVV